jgi:predicted kinase
MRKWMRERIKRRKKQAEEPESQPAPPPLQPAYFDPEPADEAPASDAREGETQDLGQETPEAEPVPEESAQPEAGEARATRAAQGGSGQRTRGRRRRGGRGRGGRAGSGSSGREQAVAQAFAPSGGKSVPETPAGDAESEPESGGSAVAEPEAEPAAAAPEAPAVPAVVPPAPARPPKGIVVLAIGLPGSGKSSWFKRHNVVPLSSDMVRSLLFDDVREQRFQDLVFSNLRSMLKARLIAKRPMNYVDATNLTPQERQHWIKLAKDYNYEVHAVFFDVPLDVCIDRHQRRDRVVPEDAMRRMAAKLKPPTFEEGFAKITVVRVKKKDGEPAAEQ